MRQMAEKPELFEEFLRFQGRVFKHSPVITLEFFLQKPGARYIATEAQWKTAGYTVAHGNEGIFIRMPDGTTRILFDYSQCEQSKPEPNIWRIGSENESAVKQGLGIASEKTLLQGLTEQAERQSNIAALMEKLRVSPEKYRDFGESFISTVRTIIAGRLEIGGNQTPANPNNAAMSMLQTDEQRLAFLTAASQAARTVLRMVEQTVTGNF